VGQTSISLSGAAFLPANHVKKNVSGISQDVVCQNASLFDHSRSFSTFLLTQTEACLSSNKLKAQLRSYQLMKCKQSNLLLGLKFQYYICRYQISHLGTKFFTMNIRPTYVFMYVHLCICMYICEIVETNSFDYFFYSSQLINYVIINY
jgi:hypothetical protein